jgi:hypothetical protein
LTNQQIHQAYLLKHWAGLCPKSVGQTVSWNPARRLLLAAERVGRESTGRLKELLEEASKCFSPLEDPFMTNFGVHRRLAKDREEGYSDWLHWIIEQVEDPKLVFGLFGIAQADVIARCSGFQCAVKREVSIPEGRLDLVVSYGQEALIVVEIKVTSAEYADTAKQDSYSAWLKRQDKYKFRRAVLICVDAEEKVYEGFDVVLWADACVNLRRIIPLLVRRSKVVSAAMSLAFVGAVEQNLLELSSVKNVLTNARYLEIPRLVSHLEKSLRKEGF